MTGSQRDRSASVSAFLCLTALLGSSPSFAIAPGVWEQVQASPYPSPVAFDSARGKLVMFDGSNEGALTFEWDRVAWRGVGIGGPGDRRNYAVAYDSGRGRTVLWGGCNYNGTACYFDTWEWDGTTWERRTSGQPPWAEDFFALAYDSGRGRTVLFGGESGGDMTWEWDGTNWAMVAISGPFPPARDSPGMAYDSVRGRTVMFGGAGLGDTWEWDGVTWTQVASDGPASRGFLAMAYDPIRQRSVMYGGCHGYSPCEPFDDTWEWDGATWTQLATKGPQPHHLDFSLGDNGRMAFDAVLGRVVFVGEDEAVWVWDGTKWERLTARPPKTATVAAYDAARARTVIFVATDDIWSSETAGETWTWDGTAWTQVAVAGPSARTGHALAYDSDRQRVVLFGGTGGIEYWPGMGELNDTWEWDGAAWTQKQATGPSVRQVVAMAYDRDRHRVVLFGGFSERCQEPGFDDTWEYDGTGWVQAASGGPPIGTAQRMAYDASRRVTVLFDRGSGQTFGWDGAEWKLLAGPGPGPTYGMSMADDAARQRIVSVGGYGGGSTLDDSWEWDGTTWTQVRSAVVLAISGPATAYDEARARVVRFGDAIVHTAEYRSATITCTTEADCGDGTCRGTCDGTCHYPSAGTPCGAVACADARATALLCDGAGVCEAVVRTCAPYACDGAGACLTACSSDADCAINRRCNVGSGQCLDYPTGPVVLATCTPKPIVPYDAGTSWRDGNSGRADGADTGGTDGAGDCSCRVGGRRAGLGLAPLALLPLLVLARGRSRRGRRPDAD